MEQQTPTPPPPSLPTTTTTMTTTAPITTTYPESLDSSPRSRNTDSWGEDNSLYPSNNNGVTNTQPPHQQPHQIHQPPVLTKLRLMCSYGGHIVPRPHDKSLCYVGGDTRIVVVDRHTTLSDLTHRLSKTLLRSSSSTSLTSNVTASSNIPSNVTVTASFVLKYQLPSEDLDSLISVTTDEDLENMIEEYERLNSSADVSKSSRLRLFLFPMKPESATSIGSLLENSTKSEDWFLNALNGTTSGFSDTSSVNCLLGLDDDVLVNDKEKEKEIGIGGKSAKGNNSGQDIHSVPDLERSSSFGSASSSPSLASLPPIKVHVDDNLNQKVGGIEEQFSQMSVQQQQKVLDDGGYVSAVAPVANVVVTGVPLPAQVEYSNQQKQAMGFDMTSPDSVSSDGRQKPAMIYQDPLVQIQGSNINNRTGDLNNNNVQDQNARMQMQQQQQQQLQQMADSGYLMSMSNNQVDQQHSQMHHQQPQFIHTAVPQPQYIQHHPSGAVPMASYYQMYPSQNQHHPVHPQLDQQNFVYYMPAPARQAPHGYNVQQMQQQSTGYAEVSSAAGSATPLSHNQAPPSAYSTNRPGQTTPKSELPAGVYGTANSGGSQFVQVPSSQHQHQPQPQLQPQYVGYSQMHPSQSVANPASGGGGGGGGGNYGYEFTDPAQGQHIYYAAQPLPPHSAAQYQTVTGEAGSYLPTDNSTKQQQQGRTQQP